jgi:hypothetical protein
MGLLSALIHLTIVTGIVASLCWVLFAASVPEESGSERPGVPFVRPRRSVAPEVKPSTRESAVVMWRCCVHVNRRCIRP